MASPWKNISKVETTLQDIMSEEYARELQDKENKKYEELLKDYVICVKPTEEMEKGIEPPLGEPSVSSVGTGGEFLDFIRNDSEIMAPENVCESDRLLAELLQAEFNKEHDEEVTRIERQTNKDSKVSVSFSKYRMMPTNSSSDSDEEDYDEDDERKNKNWDRFEKNEKMFRGLSRKGFTQDEDGVIITKHDDNLCGVRNACRVMSFPPEFSTGDAAGFDMKLSNAVFNQLKSYSRKTKKHRAHDRRDNTATAEMGIDEPTRLRLYKLISNQVLQQVNGIISTGKEAVILHADTDPHYSGELVLPKECAIKIFKTTLNEFKQRDRYIRDDYRFKDRFSKQNNRTVISMWAEKEMHNLKRIRKIGINCPEVIVLKKNMLVMSFIGDNNIAARKLKYAELNDDQLQFAYEEVVDMMKKLYQEGKLVHADLSEYNILWHEGKCWLIDVAQSVEPGHPSALEFLMRDCNNICSFFSREGVPDVLTKEELFKDITGLDSFAHNCAMLERIRDKGASMDIATAPDIEGMPDEMKPMTYPFDYAWNKTQELKGASIIPPEVELVTAGAN